VFTPYDYDAAPIGLTEAFGLHPPALRAREALRALRVPVRTIVARAADPAPANH
jgi:hypothetical protein